ncbi:MAG: efflux RND transporter periplasmic adaptor subunit [Saprospiraceae bacterium]|nr:efflux RND transporter periplasmic adaptor subunit [Saprospiraceae bacterium]
MNKIKTQTLAPVSLVIFAFAGLFYLLGGCGNSDAKPRATEAGAPTEDRIPVRTAPVQTQSIALPVHASGILSSSAEQRPSFKIGGIIRKIYVDEGDLVRPGQLLAVLDKTEIDAQVAQANQALLKAERDLGRVEGLYRDSSATLELLQNATTGRDVAKETAKIALFNQQYAEIRATRGGKIIKKLMNEGEITGPGMPVFVLFETGKDDWVVKVYVSDRDWARLSIGMNAQVHMDAYPGITFPGKLSDLAPAADPASGLYPVEIKVTPQGQRFAPGLFAQLDIAPRQAGRFTTVPVEAIIEGDGREAFVFVIQPDGESVRKVPVQVAFIEGNRAVLSQHLGDAAEVITAGAPYLTEKKKVRKISDSGPANGQ